jgi:cysteinyl-tRNA synthetase
MSKSLGNFFTARDILKIYSAEAIRMLFAQTHYGGPLNFSEELLSSAGKGLEKLNNLAEKIEEEIKLNRSGGKFPQIDFTKFKNNFESAMDDDFNTPQASAVIFDFVREINKAIAENENINVQFYLNVKEYLQQTAEGVLGIMDFSQIHAQSNGELENDLIELLIKLRTEAKQNKNYSLSDKIRDELKALGVILQDGKDKTTYKKQNS